MTIERLKRVMMFLNKEKDVNDIVTTNQIRDVIYYECGTSRTTFYNNLRPLLELKWIKRLDRHRFKISQEFINDIMF